MGVSYNKELICAIAFLVYTGLFIFLQFKADPRFREASKILLMGMAITATMVANTIMESKAASADNLSAVSCNEATETTIDEILNKEITATEILNK